MEKEVNSGESNYAIRDLLSEPLSEIDIENISQVVTGRGGTVSEVERWGKRKLAYPIEHFSEGNYVLNRFQLKPAAGKELEANLKISDVVLRHLLIKIT